MKSHKKQIKARKSKTKLTRKHKLLGGYQNETEKYKNLETYTYKNKNRYTTYTIGQCYTYNGNQYEITSIFRVNNKHDTIMKKYKKQTHKRGIFKIFKRQPDKIFVSTNKILMNGEFEEEKSTMHISIFHNKILDGTYKLSDCPNLGNNENNGNNGNNENNENNGNRTEIYKNLGKYKYETEDNYTIYRVGQCYKYNGDIYKISSIFRVNDDNLRMNHYRIIETNKTQKDNIFVSSNILIDGGWEYYHRMDKHISIFHNNIENGNIELLSECPNPNNSEV
jgi:hypothetical protein